VDDLPPSLPGHYTRFITTTGQSAPDRCIGTFSLVVPPLEDLRIGDHRSVSLADTLEGVGKTTKNTITNDSATLEARPSSKSRMKIGARTTRGIELITLM
jgi:hypothetical protein